MARQYSAKTFLRNAPNTLLERYFRQHHIDLGVPWLRLYETDVDHIFLGLERQPEGVRSSVDTDFRRVNELACAKGVLSILNEAAFRGKTLADAFGKMKNHYERALWTFLFEPIIFGVASNFHEMDRRRGWKRRFVGLHREAATDDGALRMLERELRLHYRRQGRGRCCHIDFYRRYEPERYCCFIYVEDYASTEVGFDDQGQFCHRPRRPALEVIFVYRPDEGVLEVSARAGKEERKQLESIFCAAILGLDELPDERHRMPYDLSVLKDARFPFETEPEDRIQSVQIRQLRFHIPGKRTRQLSISVKPVGNGPTTLGDLTDKLIDRTRPAFDEMSVSQAKLRLAFASTNGGRPKTLTFEIGCPDRCTLTDDPWDRIARKYLRKWGIAR